MSIGKEMSCNGRVRLGSVGAAVLALLVLAPASAVARHPRVLSAAQRTRLAHSVPGIPGLPTGVPPAAVARPASLPEPSRTAWPFPNAFSRTEGSGRLDRGAELWTDFVYDDHGPMGNPAGIAGSAKASDLAPVHGGFLYPAGKADNNGADIFTAAVGYSRKATFWRVDWNTLADPKIPVAEWTMTGRSGSGAPTPTTKWPGNAGLSTSTGIQYALIVTARRALLVKAAAPGAPVAVLHTTVDMRSRSFIVKIPARILPARGTWRVQLAAGLANSTGTGFATVQAPDGASGNGVNVYNVTFRSYRQEGELVCPAGPLPDPGLTSTVQNGLAVGGVSYDHLPVAECGNFWMENDQANTLASGNVARYGLSVNWSKLAHKATTPQPLPTGYTNRWYVSPLKLGQGVRYPANGTYTGPVYLGRVQPYAVYVPTGYRSSRATKLTWVLHSLGANLNQYGGVAPSQLKQECQDRNSICATTEGFSEGQWYYAESEVDFWDVWHQLTRAYDLNPDATVMSGYSMGGWASYKLPEEYPDLFSQSMPLEGPVVCGMRVYGPIQGAAGAGQCTTDGDSTPLLVNLRWIPYVMTYGAIDELVPFTGGQEQIGQFRSLGYRFYAVDYPAEDHMVFSVQNDFTPADSQLGSLNRVQNPGAFTFTWYPDLVGVIDRAGRAGQIGPTSDYWISGLGGRTTKPGARATVTASSGAIPQAGEKPVESYGVSPLPEPTPAVIDAQRWSQTGTPTTHQAVKLELTNVGRAAIDTVRAGLRCGTISVTTDGPTALTLIHLRRRGAVRSGATTLARAHEGRATVTLARGTTVLEACSARG